MNRTNRTNDPIWYLIRIGGSNSTNSIAFQPFSRFSRFGRFGRFLQFCLILEIPLSYRRKKYSDKIRSAEGTDPIFLFVYGTGGTGGTGDTGGTGGTGGTAW